QRAASASATRKPTLCREFMCSRPGFPSPTTNQSTAPPRPPKGRLRKPLLLVGGVLAGSLLALGLGLLTLGLLADQLSLGLDFLSDFGLKFRRRQRGNDSLLNVIEQRQRARDDNGREQDRLADLHLSDLVHDRL